MSVKIRQRTVKLPSPDAYNGFASVAQTGVTQSHFLWSGVPLEPFEWERNPRLFYRPLVTIIFSMTLALCSTTRCE
jgi:hypothetical protein